MRKMGEPKYCPECSREFPYDEGEKECSTCAGGEVAKEAYQVGYENGIYHRNETLREAKRLLSIAKIKLISPGRFETFSEEIERFLNDSKI